MFAYIFVIFFVILLVYWGSRKNAIKGFNGPIGLPIVGNYFSISKPEKALAAMYDYPKLYGKNVQIKVGFERLLFTSDIKLVEKILTSQELIKKSKEYTYLKRWWGEGLLTSTGAKWRSRRKILTPAFHYGILEDFLNIFQKHSGMFLKNIEKNAGKDSFDITKIFSLYTLDVICESSMGTFVDAQSNPEHAYLKAIIDLCDLAYTRMSHPFFRYDLFYNKSKLFKKELKLVAMINAFSLNIIRNRREVLMNLKSIEEDVDKFGKKRKSSFLDILLKSTHNDLPLSDDDIREEVDTFLFEGFDTTSIALSFIAYNLAHNPDVQEKIIIEQKEVLAGDFNKRITIEDLNNMKYLEMAIKESLRLYPSVPLIARSIEKDFEYDGNIIPKGVTLAANIWDIHRNENVFSDALKYNPERFSYENKGKYGAYEYIPFSAGYRNCIGQKFAMYELKTVISKLLIRYELKPAKPEFVPRKIFTLTLASLNGVHIRLDKRLL